jgi:hypothetical protein
MSTKSSISSLSSSRATSLDHVDARDQSHARVRVLPARAPACAWMDAEPSARGTADRSEPRSDSGADDDADGARARVRDDADDGRRERNARAIARVANDAESDQDATR